VPSGLLLPTQLPDEQVPTDVTQSLPVKSVTWHVPPSFASFAMHCPDWHVPVLAWQALVESDGVQAPPSFVGVNTQPPF
jgi:hypothetical protein